MPKGSEVKEVIRGFTGQKSSIPSGSLEPTDAEKIINFTVRKFRLRKVWGASLYANLDFGDLQSGVDWVDRFRHMWFCQRGNSIGKETADGSKVFEEIGTISLGTTTRVRSEKWRNRIYMTNGVENKFYEDSLSSGEKYLTLGLIPPGNGLRDSLSLQPSISLELNTGGSGQFDNDTKYEYVVTFWDNTREIESLPNGAEAGEDGLWSGSKPANITTTGASQLITIDISDVKAVGYDEDRVTHWIVYRRKYDSTTDLPLDDFKRIGLGDGLISIESDSVQDSTEDDDLGTVLDESLSPPPSGLNYSGAASTDVGPRFIKEHNDQLWLFGPRYPGFGLLGYNKATGIAYASRVGFPDYFEFSYDVGYADDQKDTGLAKYRNTLIFFKSNSIYYLDGTNPGNYAVRELDNKRGAVASGSIQETPVGVIALSSDGFILVDSVSPARIISESIFDEIQGINFSQIDKIVSAYNMQEGKYECHIPMRSSLNANKVFVYDINTKSWDFRNKNVGGSAHFDIGDDGERVGLLGDPNNGRLYDLVDESQVTFNGQKIAGRWASKHFDFGEPDKLKRLVSMRLKARSAGAFSLDIDVVMDNGQQETYSLKNVNSESVFTTLAASESDDDGDELVLDQGQLSEDLTWKKFEIMLSGVARNFQVIIRESGETDNSRGFEIDEIVLVGNLLGR